MPTIRDMNQGIAAFPLLAPNGSVGAPSYAFASHPEAGIWSDGSGNLVFTAGSGQGDFFMTYNEVRVGASNLFGFSSNNQAQSSAIDAGWWRDAADTIAQKRGTNPQEYRVYNTFVSSTNYELGKLEWASNNFNIGTEKGSGGGTARGLSLVTDSTSRLDVDGGGNGVWNEGGASVDLRAEGDTDANLLFLDGSADAIGIGTSSPSAFLHLKAGTTSMASARFPASTAPSSPNEGDSWNDSTQKAHVEYTSAIKQALVGCIFTQTANATVAGTAAETTLVGSGVGTATLPANFFTVGKTVRITLAGRTSAAGTAAQTLRIRIKYGSTVLLDSGAIARTAALTNRTFAVQADITCRTTGATGTVSAQSIGGLHLWTAATLGANSLFELLTTGTVTIDTTAASALDVTADWNSAVAGDTITCSNLSIEVLN